LNKISNICISISYDGSDFFGSQSQLNLRTVQSEVSKKLDLIFGDYDYLTFASRTDKGVNADLQYFGFKKSDIDTSEIFLKFNLFSKNLPNDIVVRKICLMPNGFNVRKNVSKRTYTYKILDQKLINKLDVKKMILASNLLEGEHNFRSFAGRNAKDKFFREIFSIKIKNTDQELEFQISGKSFIHQQIRRIIFSLLRVGLGKEETDWLSNLIKFPIKGGSKGIAPSNNLTLKEVLYDKKHQKLLEKV